MTILHARILEIYKEFKRVCDKYNLRYYATGGTAIGAARHEGFIPWDDDLDIDMPAPDYIKFLKIADKELGGSFQLFNGLDHKTDYVFAKIHDTSTMLTTSILINSPESYTGVFIDIFPLVGMPDKENDRNRFEAEQIKYIRQLYAENILPDDDIDRKTKGKKTRLKNIKDAYVSSLNAYDFDSAVNIRRAGSTVVEQSRFLGEWYKDYIEVTFEDTTMRLPTGYHDMLTSRFGDYMTLPEEGLRRPAHEDGGIVDLNTPYSDYRDILTGEKPVSKELTIHFAQGLARLANYEMMRYVYSYWDLEKLEDRAIELEGVRRRLEQKNEDLKNENNSLSNRIQELDGIKKSSKLVLRNIKRRLNQKSK